jgi:hypothetical protein
MRDRDDLLAAYREHRGPSPRAVERIHRRLEALGPARERATVIELTPERGVGRRARIAIAIAALAAAAVLGWWIRGVAMTPEPGVHGSLAEDHVEPDERGGVARPVEAKTQERRPARAPALVEATPPADEAPRVESAPEPTASTPAPASAPRARPPRQRVPDEPERTVEAPAPRRDTLAAETAIVRRARAELSRGRAQQALAILGEHEREFPRGALLEEAHAVRTMAQCRLHAGDAASLDAAFVERFPKSLFRSQVAAACRADDE